MSIEEKLENFIATYELTPYELKEALRPHQEMLKSCVYDNTCAEYHFADMSILSISNTVTAVLLAKKCLEEANRELYGIEYKGCFIDNGYDDVAQEFIRFVEDNLYWVSNNKVMAGDEEYTFNYDYIINYITYCNLIDYSFEIVAKCADDYSFLKSISCL